MNRPRVGVVVFPGTNCELDVAYALGLMGVEAPLIFHDTSDISDLDGVVIAGGFAHGDYLRPGAIARFSPVMEGVRALAEAGAPVVGICNGFQVLCESGLLPGALQKNAGLEFICRPIDLRVESTDSVLTSQTSLRQVLKGIPINHFEGSFTADPATITELEDGGRVVLRYCSPVGEWGDDSNPNGSINSIAGICNETRNVVGLMPHPERAAEAILGSEAGRPLLESLRDSATRFAAQRRESATAGQRG